MAAGDCSGRGKIKVRGNYLSRQLINEYRSELDRIKQASGSLNESTLRDAFQGLLKSWGKSNDLVYLSEYEKRGPNGNLIKIDGALVYSIRVPLGYWEAKDSKDDLDEEIRKKEAKGYPRSNIIYEDTERAVLIQNKRRVMEARMDDTEALFQLLSAFFTYEREAISDFRKAITQFSQDLPAVLEQLRKLIADKRKDSADYKKAETKFLNHAKEAINPAVTEEDVQEMLIQHILTEDIFARVFDTPGFHQQNNVARELYALEEKLFDYAGKRQLLQALKPYYAGINTAASLIESHSEKQGFLKSLYENFYKVYNPKAADRLGVVYTPGEIVRFMIRSTDYLCEKHFGKNLIDKGVDILDPATGTGTYIVELLEHFRGNREKLAHKYQEELHANEVAILPYYVANLNIEASYQAITGQFVEFPSLCLVDTLDNVDALGIFSGHQHDMFGSLSDENMGRIKRQNERKISVIIGNPPYNAWQDDYSSNNPNRPYQRVDERIKQTYIKEGASQNQNSVYDMYTRFVRWASDRIGDEGIICFIIGRKPVAKGAYDGFRKVVEREFSEIHILDLGGDVRDNPKLSGTTHNVFGIQTGVTIALLVKKPTTDSAKIFYARFDEDETAENKLSFLGAKEKISNIEFSRIKPDKKHDWLNQPKQSWDHLIPLVDTANKNDQRNRSSKAIFKLFSNGMKTQRDEWNYDWSQSSLEKKARYFISIYEKTRSNPDHHERNKIKWDRELTGYAKKAIAKNYDGKNIVSAQFRPFVRKYLYFDAHLNGMVYQLSAMFREELNPSISFLGVASSNEIAVQATDRIFDLGYLKKGNGGTQGMSRYRYTKSGERIDNITDWAVDQFVEHYGDAATITKDAIFAYCYGVLHDPVYREKYALNLKREFPRIPFYADFAQWVAWGEALMKMHIGYEDVKPWKVKRVDTASNRAAKIAPKPKLKSTPATGLIVVDEDTQITSIPVEAWDYRLGNRSAIDWVLDQHKEKKPRDLTIREKFNTYKFADYKESMIDLLAKVVRVSVDTVAITEAMKALDRSDWE